MVLDNDNLSIIITNDHKLTLSEVLPYVDRALSRECLSMNQVQDRGEKLFNLHENLFQPSP